MKATTFLPPLGQSLWLDNLTRDLLGSPRWQRVFTADAARCGSWPPREKVKLPERSMKGAYDDQATLKGRRFVPEEY